MHTGFCAVRSSSSTFSHLITKDFLFCLQHIQGDSQYHARDILYIKPNFSLALYFFISFCLPVPRPRTLFPFPSLITPVQLPPFLFRPPSVSFTDSCLLPPPSPLFTLSSPSSIPQTFSHLLPSPLHPSPLSPSPFLLSGGWAGLALGQEKQHPDLLCVV